MRRYRNKSYFPKCEWFSNIFGFSESLYNINTFIEDQNALIDGTFYSYKTNRTYCCGEFYEKSINSFFNNKIMNNGTFSIVNCYPNHFLTHADPENNGATFQLNSHFNCLEFISPEQNAEDGITGYLYNNLPASQASVATAPSLMLRNYFITTKLGKEIQMLSNTPIPVRKGFSFLCDDNLIDESLIASTDWSDLNLYKVGINNNCQVVLSQYDEKNFMILPYEQMVNHVFASSLDFSRPKINLSLLNTIEKYLLEAEYKTTIKVAWENSLKYSKYQGSKKCYLTAIGYELFNAPLELIFNAIASCENLIIESGLNVIFLASDTKIFYHAINSLGFLVQQTSGRIIK